MPQSILTNYLHLIFSVKNRAPLIKNSWEEDLYLYMQGVLKSKDCTPLIINGYLDHVHCLFGMSKKYAIQYVIQELKRSSSYWVQNKKYQSNFTWQKGYGCFSVSPGNVDSARAYIKNQKEHHRKISFEEEVMRFMRSYGINEFDTRYFFTPES